MVSIIVPIYNREAFLRRSLDSILNQTDSNFEAILVDDGSTDSSKDICMEYVQRDKRFIYHFQESAWLSASRNAGMEISKGEYITFVDPDDYIDPDYVESLRRRADETNADIVCSGNKRNIGDDIDVRFPEDKVVEISSEKILLNHFCKDWLPPGKVYAWSKLFRRKFLDDTGVLFTASLRYSEDANFCYKLLYQSKRTAYISKAMYFYWQHEKSLTRSGAFKNNVTKGYLDSYKDVSDYWHEKKFHAFDVIKPIVLIGRLKAAFFHTYQTIGDHTLAANAALDAFANFPLKHELELNKLKEAISVYSDICGLNWAEQAEIWLFALSLFGGKEGIVSWQMMSPQFKALAKEITPT